MATADAAKKRHHFPALDGLRIFAALWILLFHIAGFFPKALPIGMHGIAGVGFYGVDIFFALSGFLLAAHYGGHLVFGSSHRAFLHQRLKRIYPLHLSVLLGLAILMQLPGVADKVAHSDNYSLVTFLQHVFMVSAWKMPIVLNWNHPTWAVSAEWLLYLLSPLYFLLLKPNTKWWMAFVTVFVLLAPFCVFYFGYKEQIAYGLPRALCGFGCGILAWRWRERLQKQSMFFAWLCFPVIALEYILFDRAIFAAIPFFALLIAHLSRLEKPSRFLQIGARYTYALYLTQYPVLLTLQKLPIENVFLFWLLLITSLTSCAVIGYHCIEKLFLGKKRI